VAQKTVGSGLESSYADDTFYQTLDTLFRSIQSWTSNPLVVVLDTFEEVEHTEPELREEIYDMLLRVNSTLPLKLIVSGRAPAQPFARDSITRTDRRLEVKEFEGEHALTLLRHFLSSYPDPVTIDDDLGLEVVRTVGGNPLTLKLAASVLATEGSARLDEAMRRSNVVDRVRQEFIRGFLYQRIIEHLQASDPTQTEVLQSVARASLPLRQITADLIREVVLPALGVHHDRPEWLHEELVRTVAFVITEGDRCWLRPEVRVPALRALDYQDSDLVDRVHRLAIDFYAKATADPEAGLELAFHRLELGEPVGDVGLDPSALEQLSEWASRSISAPDLVPTPGAPDDDVTLRLERMYQIRQTMVLAEQSLGTGQLDAARTALDGVLDEPSNEDLLTKYDPRMFVDLHLLASRVYEAQDDWPRALSSAGKAREGAEILQDRTRFAALSIRIAGLEESQGDGRNAVDTLSQAVQAPMLAGDHRLRLELLLNQMTTMERVGLRDEDLRWDLELRARTLLGLLPVGTAEGDTALLRLLAATLGRDEPSLLKRAVPAVGLGDQVDGELLRNLARAMAAWDQDRENPGSLARLVGLDTSTAGSAERVWVTALTGMGPEAGYTIDRLWETEEPPREVVEALRAFLVWWGVKRPGPTVAAGVAAAAPPPEEAYESPEAMPPPPPPAPPAPSDWPPARYDSAEPRWRSASPLSALFHALGRGMRAVLGWFGIGAKGSPGSAPPSPKPDIESPGPEPVPVRPHFLDETPIDFSRREVHELERIVLDGYGRPEQLARVADLTGVDPATLDLSSRPQTMVRGFLVKVSEQGRLRDLARVMGEDTSLGSLRERVIQLTAD
jgi:hypothetical protein